MRCLDVFSKCFAENQIGFRWRIQPPGAANMLRRRSGGSSVHVVNSRGIQIQQFAVVFLGDNTAIVAGYDKRRLLDVPAQLSSGGRDLHQPEARLTASKAAG
jgi:hypothetical protein